MDSRSAFRMRPRTQPYGDTQNTNYLQSHNGNIGGGAIVGQEGNVNQKKLTIPFLRKKGIGVLTLAEKMSLLNRFELTPEFDSWLQNQLHLPPPEPKPSGRSRRDRDPPKEVVKELPKTVSKAKKGKSKKRREPTPPPSPEPEDSDSGSEDSASASESDGDSDRPPPSVDQLLNLDDDDEY